MFVPTSIFKRHKQTNERTFLPDIGQFLIARDIKATQFPNMKNARNIKRQFGAVENKNIRSESASRYNRENAG